MCDLGLHCMNEPYRFRRVPPVTMQLSAVCWASIAARAELRALALSEAHAPALVFVSRFYTSSETKVQ
jgi:hypothetical protein